MNKIKQLMKTKLVQPDIQIMDIVDIISQSFAYTFALYSTVTMLTFSVLGMAMSEFSFISVSLLGATSIIGIIIGIVYARSNMAIFTTINAIVTVIQLIRYKGLFGNIEQFDKVFPWLLITPLFMVLIMTVCKMVYRKFIDKNEFYTPREVVKSYFISYLTSPALLILVGISIILSLTPIYLLCIPINGVVNIYMIVLLIKSHKEVRVEFHEMNQIEPTDETKVILDKHCLKVKIMVITFGILFFLTQVLPYLLAFISMAKMM